MGMTERSTWARRSAAPSSWEMRYPKLSLGLRSEDMERGDGDLPGPQFRFAEEAADLGTVPVGDHDGAARERHGGDRRGRTSHLSYRFRPGPVVLGALDGVSPQCEENPTRGRSCLVSPTPSGQGQALR